jgi:hypothetical protein
LEPDNHDTDLKKLFEVLRSDLSKDADERFGKLEKLVNSNANKSLEHHQTTARRLDANARQMDAVTLHVRSLWRKVNGSEPPPPHVDPTLPPPGKGLDDMLSSHDMDLAAFTAT